MTQPAPVGAVPATVDDKSNKRKQTIIATGAVLGVLLTYMLYRRSKTASSAGGTATVAAPLASSGAVGASDAQTQALTGLSNQISGLVSALTPSATPTATADPFSTTLLDNYSNFYATNVGQPGGAIYGIESGAGGGVAGKVDHITGNDWLALNAEGAKIGTTYNVPTPFPAPPVPKVTPAIPLSAGVHADQQVP